MKTTTLALMFLLMTLVGERTEALPLNSPPELRKFEFTAVFDCVDLGGENDCQSELYGIKTHTGYSGRFSLKESALDTDGTVFTEPYLFYFQIGGATFDSTDPCSDTHPSDFCNFKGYQDPSPFDGRWTVSIENGRVLGLCCGLYGDSDATFIDMSTNPPNPDHRDNYFGVAFFIGERSNSELLFAKGTFTWREITVPEPSSAMLMLLASVVALVYRMAVGRLASATT
jgi:hypothetical protein